MRLIALLLAALLPLCAQAFSPEGLSFSHHDWELACDNTGTCRAAGYSADAGGDYRVSVLLTRPAGPGQAVSAQALLGEYGDNKAIDALPARFSLAFKVNGQDLGQLAFDKNGLNAELTARQVNALVAALARNADIRLVRGRDSWQLSDQGAAAVLLKIDEYQGRLGTPGALLKKGSKPESQVPAAVPAPLLKAAPVAKAQAGDEQFIRRHGKALLAALRASVPEDDCDKLHGSEDGEPELAASRLAPGKMLVSSQCWLAAYNFGSGYWVVNDKPPFQPVLVTTSASDASEGRLHESHKGRGLGDCFSSRSWTWDGRQFRLASVSTTGMCRLMAAGGAWELPTLVTREQ